MSENRYHLWPIAIIQDRYSGIYSDGAWLAIAKYNALPELRDKHRTRLAIVEDGAHGDDGDAQEFWWDENAAAKVWWLAVGNTPEEALRALYRQDDEERACVRQVGVFHPPPND